MANKDRNKRSVRKARAEERARAMVNQDEIVRQAQQKANEMIRTVRQPIRSEKSLI